MNSLQERDATLIGAAPMRVNSHPSRHEPMVKSSHIEDRLNSTENPSSKTALPLKDTDSNYFGRFNLNFRDEQFQVKEVPYSAVKRFFDVSLSLFFLVPASLLMLPVALLIKLTSKGPIFFSQVRVGQGGRYFNCFKFRSMCIDAEAQKEDLMHLNEASGPVFKIKKDPRITPIGAIIRKFSIDELPQFFNILRGDMSIVGPRPPIPCEVAEYGAFERKRLAVRPGLTCLWQIGGRSNVSFERWVQLDVEYIESMSFKTDVLIVLKTVPVVLKGSGAH